MKGITMKGITMEVKERKRKCWSCKKPVTNLFNEYKFECPHCKVLYADKPINEAKLHTLQELYLVNNDTKILNRMMIIMQDIVYNLICSKLRSSGKMLEEEDVLDKVQWTLLKMTQYYSRPSFKITSSFTEYLSQVVLYPLYNYKQKDQDFNEISIHTPIGNNDGSGDSDKTILDRISDQPYLDGNCEVENFLFKEIEKENVVSLVNDFIHATITVANRKQGFSTALKILRLYKHYLNKCSERFFGDWWKIEGHDLRNQFEESLTLLRTALYESSQT